MTRSFYSSGRIKTEEEEKDENFCSCRWFCRVSYKKTSLQFLHWTEIKDDSDIATSTKIPAVMATSHRQENSWVSWVSGVNIFLCTRQSMTPFSCEFFGCWPTSRPADGRNLPTIAVQSRENSAEQGPYQSNIEVPAGLQPSSKWNVNVKGKVVPVLN
jgi:hypothetical protein